MVESSEVLRFTAFRCNIIMQHYIVMEGKGLDVYMWGIMDLTILIKNNACKLFSHFKRSSLHHSFRTLVNTLDALVWSVFLF